MKFPSLVFEIWCLQGFWDAQTHALTHRRTDLNEYCMLPAPFFNGVRGIKCHSTAAEILIQRDAIHRSAIFNIQYLANIAYYFISWLVNTVIATSLSHGTARLSAECSCSRPSSASLFNGHDWTVWFIVCGSTHRHLPDNALYYVRRLAASWPCSVQKQFSMDHKWWVASKHKIMDGGIMWLCMRIILCIMGDILHN